MAAQRSAQSFLRSDLIPFFNPLGRHASHLKPRHTVSQSIARRPPAPLQRCQFASSSRHRQQAPARKDEDDDSGDQSQARGDRKQPLEPAQRITLAERHTTAPPQPAQRTGPRKDSRISFLDRARTAPATPPRPSPQAQRPQQGSPQPGSPPSSKSGQRSNPDFSSLYAGAGEKLDFARSRSARPGGNQEQYTTSKQETSLDDFLSELGLKKGPDSRVQMPASTPYRQGDRTSFDLTNMRRPGMDFLDGQLDPTAMARKLDEYNKALSKAMAPPTFRVGPGLGRTVTVATEKGMDVARAFAMVNVKCNANSVRQDMQAQRFHERPGVRRKRLYMLRWRRRFKEAFRATVRRVEDMRRKGW